jgi:LmbE family N-acetylglucosaminyl deacetylase
MVLAFAAGAAAQSWSDLQGRSDSGLCALHQAVADAGTDALALIVASHPDDRYLLPAAWLRHTLGIRVAVLLATRGGGGQNSRGPETGDKLERIRTLEAEAGCTLLGAQVWYLDRVDAGFRRSAEEAIAEWGREGTIRDLVRMVRTIRPDFVVTTHHVDEDHGHAQAIAELLPEAVRAAGEPAFVVPDTSPHSVQGLYLGASSVRPPSTIVLDMEAMDPLRGTTLRRFAYQILAGVHISAGPLLPIDAELDPELRLVPQDLGGHASPPTLAGPWRSLCDQGLWPGEPDRRPATAEALSRGLSAVIGEPERLATLASALLRELRALPVRAGSEAAARRDRRVEAVEQVLRHACGVQIEISAAPGAVAVPGEELALLLSVHAGAAPVTSVRLESLSGGEVVFEPIAGDAVPTVAAGSTLRSGIVVRMPLRSGTDQEPMAAAFRGDRFVSPVRLRCHCGMQGVEVPIDVTVPVTLQAAVQLEVLPRALLLPLTRQSVKFTVGVLRNSSFPVHGTIEVRAPAGYVVDGSPASVELRNERADSFLFEVRAPEARKTGVDVLRVALGDRRVALPVHKIDVRIDQALRVGVVKGNDDTLLAVVGIGGLGLHWSELGDADLAVRDLDEFDSIVVDIRALRDRPVARRCFRRLLEFCAHRGRRLVVFYHKDTEFNPPGESFRGAPFAPFQLGKERVTRADAPVQVLRQGHVLLSKPNEIRASDWDGWGQERALYLPAAYGEQYEEVLEMHDPERSPQRSALLYARTGDGEYVYCALALYRQLKKLHPGAVRLLANLLTPMTK